jgi:NhaP-type Na+/H+ and K+/H+ antiporter
MGTGEKRMKRSLGLLTILTICNLLLTASVVSLVGGIVILVMAWGIRKGDYPLTKALAVVLFVVGGGNLAVLVFLTAAGSSAKPSALAWLGIYSLCLIVLGVLLRSRPVQEYLKTAPQPEEKEKKIHFFHGGWRDL